MDSELVDNAHHGILSDRIVATRSTIRDNHSGDRCGVTLPCADLENELRRAARRSSRNRRETSHRGGTFITGETWRVCSLD